MPPLKIRAILTGLLVDLAGSFAAAVIIITLFVNWLRAQGIQDGELERLLMEPERLNNLFLVLVAAGVFFDGLAGYVTARTAGMLEYWHVLCLVVSLWLIHGLFLAGDSINPAYQQAALFLGAMAAFMGGGLAKRRRGQSIDPS